ncbi:MAG TPA: glutamine amidotransferase family protein [Solirubrobacterales bacterium]|jgi:amidophosphoribosyltransferase|nr:glutamine amidotransferase family protein [Solirubrobacterales bacterium]
MCGIVGIFSKSSETSDQLGAHLARMLVEMADRGPDSAGIAIYRDPLPAGTCKISLHAPEGDVDWAQVKAALGDEFTVEGTRVPSPGHALLTVTGDAAEVHARVEERLPQLRVMSAGRAIEIYKEAVAPAEFVERFEIDNLYGSHALGHTRMATESRVSTDGSHPFSTGLDLCLVHNGSLSNHNLLRRSLRREGIPIQTQNDSEVAAGYLTWRMREGDTLEAALERSLDDLDGFFTFAVGTADGFAVLRDPIACKPAVIAETDDWVAIASEYRALAVLPGAEEAEVWEPEPGRVYSWAHEVVA